MNNACPVEESHRMYQRRLSDGEARDTQLRQQMPLVEFEDEAVALLLADGFINAAESGDSWRVQAAADRIALFHVRPDLMPVCYDTDGLTRDEGLLSRYTEIVIEQICQRLQDEYVSDPRNQP